MGPLPPPTSVGVLIAGLDYQWLHAWEACLTALLDRLDGKPNPIVMIGAEVDGVGNLDDVVRYRQQPPHVYSQVKYAVGAATPVNEEYLLKPSASGGPSILEKIATAWRRLTQDGAPVELSLITNRSLDATDPLVSLLDRRSHLLMPAAGSLTGRSKRGKARIRWAEAAGLPEHELLRLLENLQFRVESSWPGLCDLIQTKMRTLALPYDDKALADAISWVSGQVKNGVTAWDLDALDRTVAELWPQASPPQFSAGSPGAGAASSPGRETVLERLRQLPGALSTQLIETWQNYPGDTWQLIAALTQTRVLPTEVLAGWADRRPGWLRDADPMVRLLAGELAGAYGQLALAAELFQQAALAGAPRADFWLARAALIYDELGNEPARAGVVANLGERSREPYARAVVALLAGDAQAAAAVVERWAADPDDRAVRTLLRVRVALTLAGAPLPGAALSRAIEITGEAPAPPVWSTALAFARAQLLILRARRSESANWDEDLWEAADLLMRVRDERRVFRGDSASAVALLCQVRLMQQDAHAVIRLASYGERGATRAEGDHPQVRESLAVAAVQIGDLQLARACLHDLTDEVARVRVGALVAEAEGGDPVPLWRRAIELADNEEELGQALYGLAQTGADDLPRLAEFAAHDPELAVEIQAQAEFASGRHQVAIRKLRSRRRDSISSALTLAYAYGGAGRIDDQVQTLTDAARHFGDASLRLTAAEVLARNDRFLEAERLLEELLAHTPADWSGRDRALRLAAFVAQKGRRYERACELLRAVLRREPSDTAARWVLIDILVHRGELNAAWRELCSAPEPLDPPGPAEGRLWIQLNVRRGSLAPTIAMSLRLLRRFSDNDDFSEFVVTNLLILGVDDTVPASLQENVRTEISRFARRESTGSLRTISATDTASALAQLRELAGPSEEQLQKRRGLQHGVLTGTIPLSLLAAATGRSYAEVLLLRGGSVIPARHPDPAEHAACLATVSTHIDADIVLDTTTAVVLNILTAPLRNAVLGLFARGRTTDSVMIDALAARDALGLRRVGFLVYDEQQDAFVPQQISVEEAERLAVEADELVDLLGSIDRLPSPDSRMFDFEDAAPMAAWASAANLAHQQHTALWSDDPVLRLLAREAGIPATSTPALLEQLLDRGDITAAEHEAAIRNLIIARVADFPPDRQRLLELAEEQVWLPQAVAHVLGRPAAWQNTVSTGALFGRLVGQAGRHQPHTLPDWLYTAALGASARPLTPTAATDITARLLAIAMQIGQADATTAAALTAAARTALTDSANPDHAPRPDPLPACVRILRDAYAPHLPPDRATQLALSFIAAHNREDRLAAAEALLID